MQFINFIHSSKLQYLTESVPNPHLTKSSIVLLLLARTDGLGVSGWAAARGLMLTVGQNFNALLVPPVTGVALLAFESIFQKLFFWDFADFVVLHLIFGVLTTKQRIPVWETPINCQNLRECLSSLQETSQGIHHILILPRLGILYQGRDLLDK